MRLYKRSVVAVAAFSLVAGCKLLNRGTPDLDASIAIPDLDAGAVVAPPAVVVTGANADDVARFNDEQPLASVDATILSAIAIARTAPPAGPVVTTLKKDSKVVQIAKHDEYFLAAFDDPKNPSQKLMGWIHETNFTGKAVITTCSAGLTLFKSDVNFCAKECTADSNCTGGQVCKGTSARASDGKTALFCTARPAVKDAGTTPALVAVDAGVKVDAGSVTPPTVVDAGSAAAKKDPEKPSMGGGCEPGYRLVDSDKRCHLICQVGTPGVGPQVCGGTRCTATCGSPAVCAVKPNCAK